MTARYAICAAAWAGVLASAAPARADVIAQTDQGFVSRNVVVVAGSPAAVWKRLVTPAAWWSSDHTFSGDAANMTLDPVAGGCFCEKLPADDGEAARPAKPGAAPHPPARGGVQHMRVVFIDHAKALRMVGALGPLQSEAVSATLTITLKPVDGGTRVIFEYVVGGYMRYPADKIANAVDIVMGNQLLSLAKQFGPVAAPREENAAPGTASEPASGPAPARALAPVPVRSGGGLGRNGLLVPRGKVWSLPSGPPPEPAPPPLPAAPAEPVSVAAPLPTAPVQEDLAPSGGSAPAVTETAPEPAPAPAPRHKAAPKKAAKPAPKPAPTSDEPSKDSINSAFDAAFGGAPRPAPDPR